MGVAFHFANAISIALFLLYGLQCLFADGMVDEFERYGLTRFRKLTGALEVLGAVGLAAGYFVPFLTALSASGLALLMLLGLAVRIRVRDSTIQMLPAAFLLGVTAFIAASASGWLLQ
ncbi:MAG: hypothetical protein HKO53_12855 [Gemmatimonadetes bacterium]|nr:hypothetical protein [Gemmatimonadota bacterium]